jgi:sulfatase modifying factor 1
MAVASLGLEHHPLVAPATVFVPGGRFSMGCSGGRIDEGQPLELEVRPLRIGRSPVSNLEYAWYLSSRHAPEPPWWKDPAFWDPEQPVVGVTWLESRAYCEWLSAMLGGRWRLPTEAEWEHAARGGLCDAPTCWGDEVPAGEVPEPPRSGPWPLGRGTANGYGLLDVGTVVHEWCSDWYAPDAWRRARRYDPRGPESGVMRAYRGGSWRQDLSHVRPSERGGRAPDARAADHGFRVVREVP